MAIDPVCGMQVDETSASSLKYEGQTYYFCSEVCREEFENDPEEYISPAA